MRNLAVVATVSILAAASVHVWAMFPPDYDFTREVDVFIGTGGHGHTFPGASMPFGMVQLSPDTRNDGSWDSCAGYHLSDSSILGFSHTHLSGTGVPDYGDILVMPLTGDVKLVPGDPKKPHSGYRSRFRHSTEKAEPGYYTVFLDDYGVKAELTASDRVGFHRYTFSRKGTAQFLVDLIHRDPVTEGFLRVVSDRRLEGFRHAKYWAGDQYHYFAMEFSKPFGSVRLFDRQKEAQAHELEGTALQALLPLQVSQGEAIEVKVATSAVSAAGAWKNLEAEGTGVSFDQAREAAHQAWKGELGKVEVSGGTSRQRRTFYTALYHCLLTPNLFQDVDGQYRGMDGQVHHAEGFTNYTVFSLWDTFRGLHPLLTILEPKRDQDFVRTLVNMSRLYGELPMWELAANDTRCMIGYHAVPVIVDAWAKGLTNFDLKAAYAEMKRTALLDKRGLKDYRTLGYVPANKGSQSVSKTLEYAYDDWCIAQAARALGKTEDSDDFMARSEFYRDIWDPSVGFMRGKDDAHAWSTPFDPQAPGINYTEGNAFQYSLFVPQNVPGLLELVGGKAGLAKYLDRLFTTKMTLDLGEENDISGLIGQYAHGNEPSHHLAYFYCFAGEPWKAQAMVRRILNEQYDATPGGLNGNEDCGQMSAWYVLSAMGFYSVCPGRDEYVIGSPLFPQVRLRLRSAIPFVIWTEGNGRGKPYIQSALLNGARLNSFRLKQRAIVSGGELDFYMGSKPQKSWGLEAEPADDAMPRYTPVAYLERISDTFLDHASMELKCDNSAAEIRYTLDGSTPNDSSKLYEGPFEIQSDTTLNMRAYARGMKPSLVTTRSLKRSKAIEPAQLASPGLKYRYYQGIYRSVYDFARDLPAAQGVVERPDPGVRKRDDWYAIAYEGWVKIPKDGTYTFYVSAKDGCQLLIDGEEQFESDGRKDTPLSQQSTLEMAAGFHRFELKYFKCTDKLSLSVEWQGPGMPRNTMPGEVFFHE